MTNFSFEFFYKIFTEDASLSRLYHGAKKSKNDQKLKSRGGGGPALRHHYRAKTKFLNLKGYL